MYFEHSSDIWNDFPQLVAGTLYLENAHPTADVSGDTETWFAKARERLSAMDEGQFPEIVAWRRAYSTMGLKPTKYRCAAESLLRRFKKEDTLPSFHPLVDLCNAFSLAFATPIAVYDADKITGGICVSYADGTENYLDFTGLIEHPEKREVVFADEEGHAHSRRWCFRQSKKSVVSPDTKRALIVAESMHDGAAESIPMLMQELASILTEKWNEPSGSMILSSEEPKFSF